MNFKHLNVAPPPRKSNNSKGFRDLFKSLAHGFTLSCKTFRSRLLLALLRSRIARRSLTKFHSYGFTLAETLTTISIIGVVAVVTIPIIYRNFEDRIQISQMKTAYHIIDNAAKQMYIMEGDPYKWDWPVKPDRAIFADSSRQDWEFYMQRLAKYLPVQKYCGNAEGCFSYGKKVSGSGCWGKLCHQNLSNGYYIADGTGTSAGYGKMILKNGMRVKMTHFELANTKPAGIGIIMVDVNGTKGPNRHGYDIFSFEIDNRGIVAAPKAGITTGNTHYYVFLPNNCKRGTSKSSYYNSCSTWIMRHDNMDYKRRTVTDAEW